MWLAGERGRVEDGRARSQAGGPLGQGYLLGLGWSRGTRWSGIESLSQEVKGSFNFGQEGGEGRLPWGGTPSAKDLDLIPSRGTRSDRTQLRAHMLQLERKRSCVLKRKMEEPTHLN